MTNFYSENINTGRLTTEPLARFKEAVKLLGKNKLSRNNAFELRIMDEIDSIFATARSILSVEDWRNYSTSLDTCAKVYGYCVDHVYEETFKILGGVARSSAFRPVSHAQTPPRRLISPSRTLEENEASINCKEFFKLAEGDFYFSSISQRLGSNSVASLLLNNLFINPQLDLVVSSQDLVSCSPLVANKAEVNLEGIVTFSENELIKMEFFDSKAGIINGIMPSISDIGNVRDIIYGNIENFNDCESIFSVDQEFVPNIQENYYEDHQQANNQTYEERIDINDDFNYIKTSKKVWFSRDSLVKNVTERPKKRRRQPDPVEEFLTLPIFIQKIEEASENENLICKKDLDDYKTAKLNSKTEKGYREGRLTELFTRNGRYTGISSLERGVFNEIQDNDDPLWIDPTGEMNSTPLPLIQEYLNIKKLKESVWNLCERHTKTDFFSVLAELSTELEEEEELKPLSVHTCFMIILHLANEQNLELKKIDDCNFQIIIRDDKNKLPAQLCYN
jgi:Condensin complex subunit 2